jgi:hypothetical protein
MSSTATSIYVSCLWPPGLVGCMVDPHHTIQFATQLVVAADDVGGTTPLLNLIKIWLIISGKKSRFFFKLNRYSTDSRQQDIVQLSS